MPLSAPTEYVELRSRSAFSFLDGASNPEDLAERAAELGHGTLALGDRDGLSGIPRFHAAARRQGLHAIVGAQLSSVEGHPLLLLAESQAGYARLSRLLTVAQSNAPKGEAHVSWSEVEAHAGDLIALVRGEGSLTRAFLDRSAGTFGAGNVWVDVSRHRDKYAEAEARFGVALAEAAGVPIVATGDVRVARPEGRKLLDAFACLRAGQMTTLDKAGRLLLPNGERILHTPEAMARRFADHPAWLHATREIAERCAFTLDDLGYRFPTFPTESGETQQGLLRRLTLEGARRQYGRSLSARVRAQLEHELAVIGRLELAGYFLIVWDIARFARESGILVQGRGSAANSAVCYALQITAVDPVGMELLFERFLSEERGEWPDIDLDLPSGEPREKVIQYVYERYGPHGVGMTATVISYRTRSAFREMGKVLGIPLDVLDRLSKKLRHLSFREDLDDVRAMLREARIDPHSPRIQLLIDLVRQVQGLPRHLGQHTGGLVVAAGRLDAVVPIEPATMENRRIIQWDKDDCADVGLIKIDLLGLGMLDALERTIPLIRRHEGVDIDLAHLPADDPKTYAMIQRADTTGVFQIESRAQMATLPRMKPRCFYDLVVEIAIIRPGPIVGKMVHPYLNRRAGREEVTYAHPALEPILKRTLGVPIFQEQLLRMAMEVSGFTGGEAEELRRAMGFKRSVERMEQIEARLRAGMRDRGIHADAQDEIVRGITSFALYGFPESHSASFALIAYASAYLRAHHPAAFLAGMLNAFPLGFYSPATLVKDAQRHGVTTHPVDTLHSDWECTLESTALQHDAPGVPQSAQHPPTPPPQAPDGARAASQGAKRPPASEGRAEPDIEQTQAPKGARSEPQANEGPAKPDIEKMPPHRDPPSVRIGLRYIKGLSSETGERLIAERRRAPFTDLGDLVRRVGPKRNELEALAESGALGSLDPAARERRSALWQVTAIERDPTSLFAGRAPPEAERSPLLPLSPIETTLTDYRTTGLTAGPHVMTHLRTSLAKRGVSTTAAVRRARNGRFVRVAGHVIVRQRPGSAKGFCFVTLEDETGTTNGVLTPDVYARLRRKLHASPLLEIAGPVQNVEGVVHVKIGEIRPIADGSDEPLPGSHDYH